MQPEKEVTQCYEQMNIVEKYETVIAYLYPIAQNIPRKHGVAKAMFIECLLEQVKLIVEAGKSGQISRLADTCNLFNHLENRYGIHCHQHP